MVRNFVDCEVWEAFSQVEKHARNNTIGTDVP
jgi:hypothetical protein